MRWLTLLLLIAAVACGADDGSAGSEASTPGVAEPQFEAVQPELLGAPGTLTNAWADVDGDGDVDLFVGFNGAPNRLYRNDGGVLVEVASEMGLADERSTRTSAWGDFDADGDPDLFVGFQGGEAPVTRLYRNDGGVFADAGFEVGLELAEGATRQAGWVDYDADGDLDLFLALRNLPNALYANEGGVFRDVAGAVGLDDPRRSVGAVWFDYQEDGDLDLLVANMNGDPNALYRNDGGRFTDVAAVAGVVDGGRGMADEELGTVRPCVVDFDNDGLLDVFMANYGPNALYRNEGGGRFRNVAPELGLDIDARYDACEFGDFDHDGRIDLFVNGTFTGGTQYRDYLFRNATDGFMDVTPAELLDLDTDHGVQWVDFDQDGALDLSLTGVSETGMHHVMRNLMTPELKARSIQVQVVDQEGHLTKAGAEVRVYAAGTRTLLGTRVLDTGSGYDSQSLRPVHFGLGGDGRVDIEVAFPGGGAREVTHVKEVDPAVHVGRPVTVMITGGVADADGRSGWDRTQEG